MIFTRWSSQEGGAFFSGQLVSVSRYYRLFVTRPALDVGKNYECTSVHHNYERHSFASEFRNVLCEKKSWFNQILKKFSEIFRRIDTGYKWTDEHTDRQTELPWHTRSVRWKSDPISVLRRKHHRRCCACCIARTEIERVAHARSSSWDVKNALHRVP